MKFDRALFNYHGGYLTYGSSYHEARFVARFKWKGLVTKAKFVSLLVKNFTVEEYFARQDAGLAPLQILREKGLC